LWTVFNFPVSHDDISFFQVFFLFSKIFWAVLLGVFFSGGGGGVLFGVSFLPGPFFLGRFLLKVFDEEFWRWAVFS